MSTSFNLSALNNCYTPVCNKRNLLEPYFGFIPIWVPHDCLHPLDNTGKGISVPGTTCKSLAKGCALSPLWARAPSLWTQEGIQLSSAFAEEMRNKGWLLVLHLEQRCAELHQLLGHHQAWLKQVCVPREGTAAHWHVSPSPTLPTLLQPHYFYLFPQQHGLCDVH